LGWLELRWAIHPRLHEVRFLTPQTYPANKIVEKLQDSNSNWKYEAYTKKVNYRTCHVADFGDNPYLVGLAHIQHWQYRIGRWVISN
jgi:hypothetical protein